jgi:hypothetical protein
MSRAHTVGASASPLGYRSGYGCKRVPGIAHPIAVPGPAPPVDSLSRPVPLSDIGALIGEIAVGPTV